MGLYFHTWIVSPNKWDPMWLLPRSEGIEAGGSSIPFPVYHDGRSIKQKDKIGD